MVNFLAILQNNDMPVKNLPFFPDFCGIFKIIQKMALKFVIVLISLYSILFCKRCMILKKTFYDLTDCSGVEGKYKRNTRNFMCVVRSERTSNISTECTLLKRPWLVNLRFTVTRMALK